MKTLPIRHSWVFPGSRYKDFPAWIIFQNMAFDDEKIVFHTLERVVVAYRGDTINADSTGVLSVIPADQNKDKNYDYEDRN